jgi:predicted transcriptional regulator YdeE
MHKIDHPTGQPLAYTIEQTEATTVIGLELRTSNAEAFRTIPPHWQRFTAERVLARITPRLSDSVFAAYTRFEHEGRDNEGQYSLVIGAAVPPGTPVPDGLTRIELPAQRCAVFEVERGRHDRVGDTWRMIWQQTDLPKSYRCEHERYDPDGRIRIFVGLR